MLGVSILALATGVIILDVPIHVTMLLVFIIVSALSIPIGFGYDTVQGFAFDTVRTALQPVFILVAIGAMIGSWIASGAVPTMITYGFEALSPGHFLVGSLLLCTVVSVATGTSWGTMGTLGIALVAVSKGLDIPVETTAGAVVSGAMFGDKMSPLSDSTNLSSALAEVDLMVHIRHMLWTTIPAFLITASIFAYIDHSRHAKDGSTPGVDAMINDLHDNFSITPIALLPVLLVIALLVLRKPPFIAIALGAISAVPVTVLLQRDDLSLAMSVMQEGYTAHTGTKALDDLLSSGGMSSMGDTVVLMVLAVAVGGVLTGTGILQAILDRFVDKITSARRLVASTLTLTLFANLMTGSNSPAHVISASLMKPMFNRFGLHRKNLSRALEDAATITGPIIPWNTAAVFASGVLGIATVDYLPYAFLCFTVPAISFMYAVTGFTIVNARQERADELRTVN